MVSSPVGLSDSPLMAWSIWWVNFAGSLGLNLHQCDYLNFPLGVPYFASSIGPFWGFLLWPVTSGLGVVASWNLACVLVLAMNAFSAYLYLRTDNCSRPASAVGALIYGFNPSLTAHLVEGHLNVCSIFALPWVYRCFCQLMQECRSDGRPSWTTLVKTACWFGLTTFLQLEHTVIVLCMLVWLWLRFRPPLLRCLPWLIGVSITAWPLIIATLSRKVAPPPHWGMAQYCGCNLLGLFLPSPTHFWWGSQIQQLRQEWAPDHFLLFSEGNCGLGLTVLVLLWLGWQKRVSLNLKPAWAGLALFWVFSLGVRLQVGPWGSFQEFPLFKLDGLHFGMPLPATLFHYLPVLKQFRSTGRFFLFAILFVSEIVAKTIDSSQAAVTPRRKLGTASLCFLLICFEFCPKPMPSSGWKPSAWAHRLSQKSQANGFETVLTLPCGWNGSLYLMGPPPPQALYDQTLHHKKLVGGLVARIDISELRYLASFPFIENLLRWEFQDDPRCHSNVIAMQMTPDDSQHSSALLSSAEEVRQKFQLGYLVVYDPTHWAKSLAYLQQMYRLTLIDQGDGVQVYSIEAKQP